MSTMPHTPSPAEVPSPAELNPADAPDLVAGPPVDDDEPDVPGDDVALPWETDQADALDQIREVGFDDGHDREA